MARPIRGLVRYVSSQDKDDMYPDVYVLTMQSLPDFHRRVSIYNAQRERYLGNEQLLSETLWNLDLEEWDTIVASIETHEKDSDGNVLLFEPDADGNPTDVPCGLAGPIKIDIPNKAGVPKTIVVDDKKQVGMWARAGTDIDYATFKDVTVASSSLSRIRAGLKAS